MDRDTEINKSSILNKYGEPDSARDFRNDVNRELRADIRHLHEDINRKNVEITMLSNEIITIKTEFHQYRDDHQETLHAAKMIVHAGMVFRWFIIAVVGLTAAASGFERYFRGEK